jgi:NAD+ kinase
VGIVAKSHLRAATPHLVKIGEWLADRGIEAIFETATAALCHRCHRRLRQPREGCRKHALAACADMRLVRGRNGTLLIMANCIGYACSNIPILGVNFGSLGFLTEVTLSELYETLEAAVTGTAHVEERLMLRSTTERGGGLFDEQIALNDAVITKTARSRMIDLSVSVVAVLFKQIKADGLIIAMPTDSKTYNLSAGGPIVQPNVDALILTPIAPHTLTNRPIVIPADSVVRVQPNMDERDDVFITFDGQAGFQLQAGDAITVRRAPRPLRVLRPTTRSYFEVLRTKLKWGER